MFVLIDLKSDLTPKKKIPITSQVYLYGLKLHQDRFQITSDMNSASTEILPSTYELHDNFF